jgi:hypothetical protein
MRARGDGGEQSGASDRREAPEKLSHRKKVTRCLALLRVAPDAKRVDAEAPTRFITDAAT